MFGMPSIVKWTFDSFVVEFLFYHIQCSMFLMLVFYVCEFLCAASCVINDDDDSSNGITCRRKHAPSW